MLKLLVYVEAKDELTTYLVETVLQHGAVHGKRVVVAWRVKPESCRRVSF